MTPKDEPETREPGVPFYKLVCECIRCGKLVTNDKSVDRKAGEVCWRHMHGTNAYARLEAQGQMRMEWEANT